MTEPTKNSIVTLREITNDNLWAVLKLEVAEEQKNFVAPNDISIAQAYFEREKAWFRAIYADDTAVGFLMLEDDPRKPQYYLWRLMIAEQYQHLGFGYRAVELLIAHVKTRPNATELKVSYVPKEGNPGPFYRKLGFVDTGEVEDGENVMSLTLTYGEGEKPAPAIGDALTHLVLFELKDRSAENIARTIEVLRGLDGKVPSLREIEVGANVVKSDRAYDIGLITRFDDLAGMQAYQVHPAHKEVLAYMGTVADMVVAVDLETKA